MQPQVPKNVEKPLGKQHSNYFVLFLNRPNQNYVIRAVSFSALIKEEFYYVKGRAKPNRT